MTFRQLVIKNIKGNFQRYSSYLLSSAFTVFIFYLFAAFLFHPEVRNQNIHPIITILLIGCELVILFFTIFFVLYSNAAFMKSRKKEFGLLKMIGLHNRQIGKLVFFEFTFISILAIIIGILFGILFSKLFFMSINAILQPVIPLAFTVPSTALWITSGIFLFLFEIITLFGLKEIRKSEIIDLLQEAKKPKSLPSFSLFLVILGIILLGIGYALSAVPHLLVLFFSMIPILILVIIGTYLLFMQMTTAVLHQLRRMPRIYLKHTNMTTISLLMFKLKDHARMLSVIAILSAVVTSSMGMLLWFHHFSNTNMRGPQDMEIIQKGLNNPSIYEKDEIAAIAEKYEMVMKDYHSATFLPSTVKINNREAAMWIISESGYNERIKFFKEVEPLKVSQGKGIFISPFDNGYFNAPIYKEKSIDIPLENDMITIEVEKAIFNVTMVLGNWGAPFLFVVSDQQFQEWEALMPIEQHIVMHDYYFDDIRNGKEFMKDLRKNAGKNSDLLLDGISTYLDVSKGNTLLMFIGVFIACLFFLASGSLIYFKMFTEIQDDRKIYMILSKLGMTVGEMKYAITIQMAILFFLPVAVGSIHTLFAYNSARINLGAHTIWYEGLTAIGIYILFQAIYFMIARKIYLKKMISQ
ncbi:ABC transporter permease [Bacillus chungangensis]|uniref:ABC transport system permease protein n=1 Tax=Bacillus chungangensis TaxID=587633 RepID=A0ABT9WMX1_9BACI|nr:FtsX-like permease family protein [Bacillus chungangensis]MDQ0174637.1 putative ABC transport system permease protein [Bacillus chungangensis]